MKNVTILILAYILYVSPAYGQNTSDDARCLLVSVGLGQQAKNGPTLKLANMSAAFYLGRLDVRTPASVAAALKAQKPISGAEAPSILKVCAVRAEAANVRMRGTIQKAANGATP
ncbi:MAG: hypothetical protein EOO38_15770 [Cytophagaceae bacterium]|nr:MAG: hypothetical protein EOO38_15770 [Cytophagaceae bacterium]